MAVPNPFPAENDEDNKETYKELLDCIGTKGEITFNYSTKDLLIHARQQHWEIVNKILAKLDDSHNINAHDEFGHSLLYYLLKFEQFVIAKNILDKAVWEQVQMEELISFSVSKNRSNTLTYMLDIYTRAIIQKPENDPGNPARIQAIICMLTQAYLHNNVAVKSLVVKTIYLKELSFPANMADKIINKTLINLVKQGADDQLAVMLGDLKKIHLILKFSNLFSTAVAEQTHGDSGRCLNVLKILLNGFALIENSSLEKDLLQQLYNSKFPQAIKHQEELAELLKTHTLKQASLPPEATNESKNKNEESTNCCIM